MMKRSLGLVGLALPVALMVTAPLAARADAVTVRMYLVTDQGEGAPVGNIRAEDSGSGLTLTPELAGLPAGPHGMHLHEKPSCQPGEKDGKMQAAQAAGDHWDPKHTGKHLGPGGTGHKGDLPVLQVAADGTAKTPIAVPYLSVAELEGHAIVIHEGADNYADEPKPMGGGGGRIACGVVD